MLAMIQLFCSQATPEKGRASIGILRYTLFLEWRVTFPPVGVRNATANDYERHDSNNGS